jgi:hypothetical protein
MRTLQCIRLDQFTVSIRKDSDFGEFRVVTLTKDNRTIGKYFTPDKSDAFATAGLIVAKLRQQEG